MLTTTMVGIVSTKPQRQPIKHKESDKKKILHSPKCTQCREEKDTFHTAMWKDVDVVRLCSYKCLQVYQEARKKEKEEKNDNSSATSQPAQTTTTSKT